MRTNAGSAFILATNFFGHSPDSLKWGKLAVEVAENGYLPAQLWLADQYRNHVDPEGRTGLLLEAGRSGRPPYAPYAHVLSPIDHKTIVVYDGKNPFEEKMELWLRKAAEKGDPVAAWKLGDYLVGQVSYQTPEKQTGPGNEFNTPAAREAAKWYGQAAGKGQKKGMLGLARLYSESHQISKALPLFVSAEAYYEASSVCIQNSNRIAAFTWWCVGNVRERPGNAPFTTNYANVNFSEEERAKGQNAAAVYLQRRYGPVSQSQRN